MPKITPARKDQRRRQIQEAAAACFARQGFHQTTIQDICTEARLSAGAVYGYFDSKDAIIAALAQSARQSGDERATAAQAKGSPIEQLTTLLSGLERPGSQRVCQLDVRLWAEAIDNSQIRKLYLQARAALIAQLAAILAPQAAALGLAPQALAEMVAAIVAGCELQNAISPSADSGPAIAALRALLTK